MTIILCATKSDIHKIISRVKERTASSLLTLFLLDILCRLSKCKDIIKIGEIMEFRKIKIEELKKYRKTIIKY